MEGVIQSLLAVGMFKIFSPGIFRLPDRGRREWKLIMGIWYEFSLISLSKIWGEGLGT
jgi:hypothetical protein